MATLAPTTPPFDTLRTLPADDVRQLMWRFTERYDLQMLVQSARGVARGPVARLVADGGRNAHEWTERKNELLAHYDAAGITAAFMEPEEGGFIAGPKNLALSLVAFELAWVDAGAATGALAGFLGLSPIHERGTPEQARHYMSLATPAKPGEDRKPWRAAFALTEPIPYVGVDTGMLSGKVRVAEWKEGEEPVLQVEKRGRFITNMGFANFVTAAVDTGDPRIKGTLHGHPRGEATRAPSTAARPRGSWSTSSPRRAIPIFSLRSRPAGSSAATPSRTASSSRTSITREVIEAVFRRTRVTVGVMTSAKLLSAVEPVIRYQRGRFRGAEQAAPGSVRYELGIQQREDALHRLVDVWATGEAGASLGFATARLFDELDPLERKKDAAARRAGDRRHEGDHEVDEDAGAERARAARAGGAPPRREAGGAHRRAARRGAGPLRAARRAGERALPGDEALEHRRGRDLLREAVSLMGGYGITEDCPGFLGQKWMDAQLEATYEGPEAVQRRQLSVTMGNPLFLAQMKAWVRELRHLSGEHPGTGGCALASAMDLWLWTYRHLERSTDADGVRLVQSPRQGVTFKLADALWWLVASRAQILDAVVLAEEGGAALGDALRRAPARFFADLCHVQAARAAGEVGRICAELVHGYNRHPAWDGEGRAACWSASDADALEGIIPGLAGCAVDVVDRRRPPGQGRPLRLVPGHQRLPFAARARWTGASPARCSPRIAPRRRSRR